MRSRVLAIRARPGAASDEEWGWGPFGPAVLGLRSSSLAVSEGGETPGVCRLTQQALGAAGNLGAVGLIPVNLADAGGSWQSSTSSASLCNEEDRIPGAAAPDWPLCTAHPPLKLRPSEKGEIWGLEADSPSAAHRRSFLGLYAQGRALRCWGADL